MKRKITLSLIMVVAFMLFHVTVGNFYSIARQPVVGELGMAQLQDSNTAYSNSLWEIYVMNGLNANTLGFLALLGGLIFLWRGDIKKLFAAMLAVAVLVSAFPSNSYAYYAKTDYVEVVEILSNQTAFLIPEVGANKTDQASFMSVDYLNANKAAMKRITIPHVKLTGSSMWADYYVPGARLLIIDRTPATREWVTATDRGTTAKDEGFRFESKESINIETGIVISAFVKEEDAAKFVYWFGAHKQDAETMSDDQRFASVIYARSLSEVIDDNVRRKVQAVLAREFGKYSLVDAAAHKADVITIVDKEVKDTFLPMGITVSYVGFAEGLTYNKEVQEAIDNVFIAEKETEAKTTRMAAVPYEQAMVNVTLINAQAEALKEAATHVGQVSLPSWVVLPQGLTDSLSGWFGGKKPAPVTATAPAAEVKAPRAN